MALGSTLRARLRALCGGGALSLALASGAAAGSSAFDFTFTSIAGLPLPLAAWRGQAILVVNTASQCGFTSQYAGLQQLWQTYRERGLVVLGVPSNDFGQEPDGEARIKELCEVNFGVDFPLTAKEHVSGDQAHPFYRWAREVQGEGARPRWNFHKYLVAPDGQLVDWFSTITAPTSERIRKAIEAHLPGIAP